MLKKLTRTLVKKESRNQLHRNLSDIPISTILTGGGLFLGALVAYSSFGVWILKIQLLPLQKGIDKLSTETKEMRMESKQGFDKLEMQMKENNDKINSRVDSVLLRSLDLQRVPKPADK